MEVEGKFLRYVVAQQAMRRVKVWREQTCLGVHTLGAGVAA